MPVKVLEAASSYDLTTVSRAAEELALTTREQVENRTLLSRLITRASGTFRSMTDRSFAKEKVEETLYIRRRTPRMILSRTPIVSIESIEFSNDNIGGTTTIDADSYFIENEEAGFVYRQDSAWASTVIAGGHFVERATQWGHYDWKVTYTGGYDLPSFSNSPDLSVDVERAVIEMVGSWFRARRTDPNVERERIGDANVTYRSSGAGGIPQVTMETVERWRRVG